MNNLFTSGESRFKFLSKATVSMLKLESEVDILKFTADTLQQILPNTLIAVFSISRDKTLTTFIHLAGIPQEKMSELAELAGFNIVGSTMNAHKKIKDKIELGKIFEHTEGLYELTVHQWPYKACQMIEQVLNIKNIYPLGIVKDNVQYGALYFLPQNEFTLEQVYLIENFAGLSGIVLQRQQLLEDLHNSEEKFRSIFESSNSAIAIYNNKQFLLVNKAWEQITGYSAEEAKSLTPKDLVHPVYKAELEKMNLSYVDSEGVNGYQFHIVDKFNNEKWIEVSSTTIEYEGERAILIIGNDITDRKRYERELNKFSTGIMNSPSSIVITDIDGNIEYVNPFFSEFTGYTQEEAIGRNPKILASGNTSKEVYDDMWSTILSGNIWNGEFQNKKKSGEMYWESVRIAPIFDETGNITNFIAIKEDITEQKRTLELLKRSENDLKQINAKKDKFFSIIAHDLRSPFSGLAGLTELLLKTHNELDNEQVEYYLNIINAAAQNTFNLLEDLLSWAKTQTGRIEFNPILVNVRSIVEKVVSQIAVSANNKNITIDYSINEYFNIHADENMLLTIIRNLVSNAIKYTRQGGVINISANEETYSGKKYLTVSVKDNGVGIPKDKIDKIFKIEENYTTQGTEKEKGTGLGLILCKEFVEKHGGKIWCESQVNKGSVFYFTIAV